MDPRTLDPLAGMTGPIRRNAIASFSTMGLGANLPASATTTFQIAAPRSTHTTPAACAEVDCAAWRGGFNVVCDHTATGRAWARRIRTLCRPAGARLSPVVAARVHGRYTLTVDGSGAETFTFAAGTPCFTEHRRTLDRPELYVVRDGDIRGNPRRTPIRTHDKPELWIEESAEHLDALHRAQG